MSATPRGAVARRELLRGLGGILGICTLPSACAPEVPSKPAAVSVPLSELEDGRRVTVVVSGNPVEVSLRDEEVVARSLLCTHTGCLVKWKADRREYVCACHQGRFDENGEVIAGSPPKPLPTLPVRVSGDRAFIGG